MPDITLIPRQRDRSPTLVSREHVDAMIDLYPGGLTWRRTFRGTLDQIPHARHFVRYLLADSLCHEDAEQVVAELAANAVQHTASNDPGGTFIIEITRTAAEVTIAVYDCGWTGVPLFGRRCRTDVEHGRGLAIVAALAEEVGYEGGDETGHRVWATIRARPSA
ncbi:ATP-binding protein [Nonomuraea insulae]|uniref:ATP-binding protein n=1 Tax=Nonomuraea insulae TaxID=1616787 RepID=A0ABW1CWD5_9ACTN